VSTTDDLQLLGLTTSASADDVKKRYRELALDAHPDRGGDPGKFNELHQAYARLLEQRESPGKRPCANCKGKRKVTQARGFSVIKVPCPECKEHR
jgi:DnaJ-class molecular chaperone